MYDILHYRPASPEKKTWQRPVAAAADEACMSDSVMSSSSVSNTNGNVRMEAANNKPPKPPRAFQVRDSLFVTSLK